MHMIGILSAIGKGECSELVALRRDDAVFHDRFLTLFPEYWRRVPNDFQFVFAGHVYWGSVWDDATVHVGPRTSAWYQFFSCQVQPDCRLGAKVWILGFCECCKVMCLKHAIASLPVGARYEGDPEKIIHIEAHQRSFQFHVGYLQWSLRLTTLVPAASFIKKQAHLAGARTHTSLMLRQRRG